MEFDPRKRRFLINTAKSIGLLSIGAVAEASIPGGVVRRLFELSSAPSFDEQSEQYLKLMTEQYIPQLVVDINAERSQKSKPQLTSDTLLSDLAMQIARSVAELPNTGNNWQITLSNLIPEMFQQSLLGRGISPRFENFIPCGQSAIGLDVIPGNSKLTVKNDYPLLSYLQTTRAPIQPILENPNLDSIGIGVALDHASENAANRILYILAAKSI